MSLVMTNSGSQARILLGCHVDHDIQLFKCLKATISPGGLEGAHEDLSSQIRGKKILVFYILQKKKNNKNTSECDGGGISDWWENDEFSELFWDD
jgi:hypothetical protein